MLIKNHTNDCEEDDEDESEHERDENAATLPSHCARFDQKDRSLFLHDPERLLTMES